MGFAHVALEQLCESQAHLFGRDKNRKQDKSVRTPGEAQLAQRSQRSDNGCHGATDSTPVFSKTSLT